MPANLRSLIGMAFVAAAAVRWSIAADDPATHDLARLVALNKQGQFAAAESLATAFIARLDQAPHPDSLVIAAALLERSSARIGLGIRDPSLAIDLAARAFGIRTRHLGPDHQLAGEAESRMAQAMWTDMDGAVRHARHALAVFERQAVRNDTLIATSYVDLGMIQMYQGRPKAAIPDLERGLAMRERLFGPDSMKLLSILSTLGRARTDVGDLERARETLDRARDLVERMGTPKDLSNWSLLSNLQYLSNLEGDWPNALEFAQMDVRLSWAAKDTTRAVMTTFNLSTILLDAGDARGAREILTPILPIADRMTGPYAFIAQAIRGSLAEACTRLNDMNTALALFQESEAACRRGLGRKEDLAHAVQGQAGVYHHEKRYRESLVLRRRGLALNDSLRPPDRAGLVTTRTQLFQAFEALDDSAGMDSVRTDLARIRDQFRFAGTRHEPVIAHWLARADYRLGRDDAAWAGALEAERGYRELMRFNIARLPDARALDLVRFKPYILSQVLAFADQNQPARWETAWDRLVRTRGLVRDEVARRRIPPALQSDSVLVSRHRDWVYAQRKLARFLVRGAAAAADSAGKATLAALRAAVDESEAKYVKTLAGRGDPRAPLDVGLNELRAALPSGSALVAFAVIEDYDKVEWLTAFVARAGDARIDRIEFGESDSLRTIIDTWRQQLAVSPGTNSAGQRRAERDSRRPGEGVRRMIWDRVEPLTARAASVFIVADGPIIDLPFHALPVDGDAYLVERGPLLRILDAEREILMPPSTAPATTLLALGDPDFSASGDEVTLAATSDTNLGLRSADLCASALPTRFTSLPGTRDEAREIATTWSRDEARTSVVLLGSDASEERFKQLAPQAAIVHLATHGVVIGDRCGEVASAASTRGVGGVTALETTDKKGATNKKVAAPATTAQAPPESSPWMGRRVWLALAAADHALTAPHERDDGVLTAEEIVTLNLTDTDWVVLSACHSGVAETWTREGALGMRRAFATAGARSVIASQWAVEDAATAEWMRALYRVRAGGEARAAAALQATHREILKERRRTKRTTHPFYWAAFAASGQ